MRVRLCVFESLYTLNCAVQLLLMFAEGWAAGGCAGVLMPRLVLVSSTSAMMYREECAKLLLTLKGLPQQHLECCVGGILFHESSTSA